jgi:hypothetical protein
MFYTHGLFILRGTSRAIVELLLVFEVFEPGEQIGEPGLSSNPRILIIVNQIQPLIEMIWEQNVKFALLGIDALQRKMQVSPSPFSRYL